MKKNNVNNGKRERISLALSRQILMQFFGRKFDMVEVYHAKSTVDCGFTESDPSQGARRYIFLLDPSPSPPSIHHRENAFFKKP